ncbi:MAG: hypothetical protein LBC88_09150 [Spirochaetaceae bacterium]|jgi:hypothetical protein|nr:hypothetical protein [Spirochaetaceae bacterium]
MMRKLVLILIAFIAAVTFIRALDVHAQLSSAVQAKSGGTIFVGKDF